MPTIAASVIDARARQAIGVWIFSGSARPPARRASKPSSCKSRVQADGWGLFTPAGLSRGGPPAARLVRGRVTVLATATWTLDCVIAGLVSATTAWLLKATWGCLVQPEADISGVSGWTGDDCATRQARPCTNKYRDHGMQPQGAPESSAEPGWMASRCSGKASYSFLPRRYMPRR